MAAGRRISDATPRIRGLDEARTSGQDVFLRSGVRAVRHAFHNLNFFRKETLGSSCLARAVPRFATASFLASPNTSWEAGQTGPVPREEKRGGSPLDGLGHIRVKRIELQFEPTRDSGQTDL